MNSNYLYIAIFILITTYSCNKKKNLGLELDNEVKPIITNQFKIDFINKILKDTSQLNMNLYNESFIFMLNLDKKVYTVKNNLSIKHLNEIQFLSLHLKSNDTIFIRKQLLENIENEDLIKSGIKSLNWDELIDYHFDDNDLDIEYFVSQDSINKVETLLKDKGILYLSTPIFNSDLNLAYLEMEHGVTGESIIFARKHNRWITKYVTNEWIR